MPENHSPQATPIETFLTEKKARKNKGKTAYLGPDLRHDAWILTAFRGKEGSPLSRQFGYREDGGSEDEREGRPLG